MSFRSLRFQDAADGKDERLFVYRFCQVAARALAFSPDLIYVVALRRQDDDGNVAGRVVAGDLPGRLKTIDARHDDVHENKVGLLVAGYVDAVCAGCRCQNLMTVFIQQE